MKLPLQKWPGFLRSMPLKRLAFIVLPATILGLFVWIVATRGPMAPIKVTVDQVREGTLRPAVAGIGTVEARRAYAVGPTQAGRVAAVNVDQGDRVTQGQLLGAMDPVDVEDRHRATRLAEERARHGVEAAAAQVKEAESRLATIESTLARFEDLAGKGFVSKDQLDAKRNEAEAARAAVASARASLRGAEQEVGRLAADAAGVAQLRRNLNLYSPTAGVITSREVEPGSTVVAGQAVFRLIDPESLWLRARVDQGRVNGVAVGQPVDIVLRSRPREVLKGRVERIELTSDEVTEERIVNVAFDNRPANWSVGELAEVTIYREPVPNALYIPSAALHQKGQVLGVWQVSDGRTVFTRVRVGVETLDGHVQILDGLKRGDEVIVYSMQALKEGSRVRTVTALVNNP